MTQEYRWASETAAHDMPTPAELEYLGWVPAERDGKPVVDPRYPGSRLYTRPVSEA